MNRDTPGPEYYEPPDDLDEEYPNLAAQLRLAEEAIDNAIATIEDWRDEEVNQQKYRKWYAPDGLGGAAKIAAYERVLALLRAKMNAQTR